MDKTKKRKPIQELSLIDDFLFAEAMLNKETAELVTRLLLERALGINPKHLIIEPQKTINSIDTDRHGIRMDVSITEKSGTDDTSEIIRVYDIEPNTRTSFSLPKRSRYYQAVTDVKLLSSGVDYDKLPELITIWILPYDPFGKDLMIYHVKNIVEEIPEMNYNDGIRKVFLYTDGKYGGSEELKKLLSYIKQSNYDNVSDTQLEKLHQGVEGIKNNSAIGVKYMQMWEVVELEKKESREDGIKEGKTISIIKILEELGTIPEDLKQTIALQKDDNTINKWIKLAAGATTIEEFAEKMDG